MMDEPSSGVIPEVWPPVDPIEPVKPRRVHWLLAPLATIPAMLFPWRAGPHLAASSWFSAYTAHVFSIVLCIGLFGAMGFEAAGPDVGVPSGLSLSEHLRRPFAAVALMLVAAAGSWPAWIGIGVAAVVIQAIVWLGAFLFMPLFSAGERPPLLYFRCVKLMLWSASALIFIGIAITLAMGLIMKVGSRLSWELSNPAAFDLFFLCVILWLSVLLRLGGRYGGPKDGPRWQSGPLRCEGCGYELTGLPTGARCPECGRAICDSLPDQRSPPLFAHAGFARKPVAFVRTIVESWSARRFASELSVLRGCAAARQFALTNCVAMGLLNALPISLLFALGGDQILEFLIIVGSSGPAHDAIAAGLIYGALAFLITVLAAVLWLLIASMIASRFGWHDAQQRTVVVCYATGWLYVPMILTVLGVYATRIGGLVFGQSQSIRLPILGLVDPVIAVPMLAFVPAAVALLFSLLRTRTMLHETRFANG